MAFGTIIALGVRFALRDFESSDMQTHLLTWYNYINEEGGIRALTKTVGDYNIPYQVFIALMTYIPINPMYGYKAFSAVFDILMGLAAARIIYDFSGSKLKASVIYVIAINLPMVFVNSAMWGQCDSIYVFFCLCSLSCYMTKKDNLVFIFLGLAFAFKFQTIFFLVFLLFMYFRERRFSIVRLIYVPIVIIVLSLPAIVQGRNVLDIFRIYINQTDSYQYISLNYPSFWNIMFRDSAPGYYPLFKNVAILITFLVLGILSAYLLSKNYELNSLTLIMLSFIFSYTSVLFLPAMHERYDYLPMMIGLILAFMYKKTIPLYIGLSIVNIQGIFSWMLQLPFPNQQLFAVINVLIYSAYIWIIIKNLTKKPAICTEEEDSHPLRH